MHTKIVKNDFLTRFKGFSQDVLVMSSLHSFNVQLSTIISIILDFLQFIELELPVRTGLVEIEIKPFCGPICLMLQLNKEVTCFTKHKPVRRHTNWTLECSTVSRQCIVQPHKLIITYLSIHQRLSQITPNKNKKGKI